MAIATSLQTLSGLGRALEEAHDAPALAERLAQSLIQLGVKATTVHLDTSTCLGEAEVSAGSSGAGLQSVELPISTPGLGVVGRVVLEQAKRSPDARAVESLKG